jgi:flagellar hook-associated protein 1 FlgK
MSGSFFGLTQAATALNAQRYALDVTGQNIANSNTAGYVRRRANLSEVGPAVGVAALYATQQNAGGVTVSNSTRVNDPVLDARARVEHGRNGYLQSATGSLSGVESLFNEPSDTGLAKQLSNFWDAWSSVANHPDDIPARNVVLQSATALATGLNEAAGALARVTAGVSDSRDQGVVELNTAATSLAQVNAALATAAATGTDANTLADQRDSLLTNIADLTGGATSLAPDGTATVVVGGQTLVSGAIAFTAAVDSSGQLTVAGATAAGVSGAIGAHIDALTTVLPGYAGKLNSVAIALSSTVNGAQTAGYDNTGAAGGPLFTSSAGNEAATIAVAVTDPNALAASAVPGGSRDASVALALSGAGSAATGADSSYRQLVADLGTDVQRSTRQAAVQQTVTDTVDGLVDSTSGVSMDEETTNLITFQRAYQAASRVLTTVDETLDVLINHTGRVGL